MPSALSTALACWFFRNENMLDFLLATQHHSPASTLSPVAGTRRVEGTFPGLPGQQVCRLDAPTKVTHSSAGKRKRSRRHEWTDTWAAVTATQGPAAASRLSLISVGATGSCGATGKQAARPAQKGKGVLRNTHTASLNPHNNLTRKRLFKSPFYR